MNIQNEHGVFNARYGLYKGKKYLFTHRDPHSGALWADDFPVKTLQGKCLGAWVPSESVRFID